MRKVKIVYDVDDVLNNLNDYCLRKLNLPWAPRFNTYENECYTKEQADALMEMYGNPETFRNLTYVEGADQIYHVEADGHAEVHINSRNFNQDVADVKLETLRKLIPGLPLDRVEMQIGLGSDKKIDLDADIIVEDCITNCLKYRYDTIKILIDKPNNQSKVYDIDESEHNIIRVDNLIQANSIIRDFVDLMVISGRIYSEE